MAAILREALVDTLAFVYTISFVDNLAFIDTTALVDTVGFVYTTSVVDNLAFIDTTALVDILAFVYRQPFRDPCIDFEGCQVVFDLLDSNSLLRYCFGRLLDGCSVIRY